MKRNAIITAGLSLMLSATLMGCGASTAAITSETTADTSAEVAVVESSSAETSVSTAIATTEAEAETDEASLWTSPYDGYLDTTDAFTNRDLTQEADLSGATYYTVADGETITITEAGVYVISGNAAEATIKVDAEDAKVQIVLDGVSITNSSTPAIYVVNAKKVWVTTTAGSENALAVTGTFTADGDTNTNAVIYSRDDLILNGLGTLTITSADKGVSSKDDLKVTGGTYVITSTGHALDANDSIAVYDGTFTITSGKDGLHAANDDDQTLGYVYIAGGTFTISAASDGIQGNSVVQIDGGNIAISASEGIEGTIVQINGGETSIYATDDGINASPKTSIATPYIEINDGQVSIEMAQGDTDALDANGSLYINGGTVNITAQFAFDFDYEGQLNGGAVYVNGEQVTEITESMMMGGRGGMGGGMMGGGRGGMGGGPRG